MPRSMPLGVICAVVLLAGCGGRDSSQELVAECAPSKNAEMRKAPYEATYVLQQWHARPTRTGKPYEEALDMFQRGLTKNDSIGFEKASDGGIVAVAGDERVSLEPGHYTWNVAQYTGLRWFVHETKECTTEAARRTVKVMTLPFVAAFFWLCPPSFC